MGNCCAKEATVEPHGTVKAISMKEKSDSLHRNHVTKEPVYVEVFEDLPNEYKKPFQNQTDVDTATITGKNFQLLLRVLMFTHGGTPFIIGKQPEPIQPPPPNDVQEIQELPEKKKEKTDEHVPDAETESIAADMQLKQAEQLILIDPNVKKAFKNLQFAGEGYVHRIDQILTTCRGYGRVYSATQVSDKRSVAIKKMRHVELREVKRNLSEIGKPTIFNLIDDTYLVDKEVWVIMEYMEGGTLGAASKGYEFKDAQISYVAREMLKGIKYLHDRNYAHRDLKSSNVMLTVQVDFGLCVDMSSGAKHHMVGSPFWMPPEMIHNRTHGLPADIWSLGVSLLEMANKKPPYRESTTKAMYIVATRGLDASIDEEKNSPEFRDFLKQCLKMNPEDRSSASQLSEHSFLSKADSKEHMQSIISSVFVTSSLQSGGLF